MRLKLSSPIKTYGTSKPLLSEPIQVIRLIQNMWNDFNSFDKARENMFVLHLDVKLKLLAIELHNQGTVDQCHVYPREVIRSAMFYNSTHLILIHNHPSGDTTPSKDDEYLNNRLKEACKWVEVDVTDHFILGNYTARSMNDGRSYAIQEVQYGS